MCKALCAPSDNDNQVLNLPKKSLKIDNLHNSTELEFFFLLTVVNIGDFNFARLRLLILVKYKKFN